MLCVCVCVCDITHNLGYIKFLTLLSNHNHWPLILGSPKCVTWLPLLLDGRKEVLKGLLLQHRLNMEHLNIFSNLSRLFRGPPTWRITSLPTVVRLNLPWFTMVVRVTEQTVVQGLVEASSPSTYRQHYDTFAVLNVLMILSFSLLFLLLYFLLYVAVRWTAHSSFQLEWSVKKMLYLQWCHRTSETPAGENKRLTLAPPTKVKGKRTRNTETQKRDWMPLHVSPGLLPIFCDYYQYFSFLTKWKNLIILLE